MARAGGTTKISPYKDALYERACHAIALDLPSRFIQDRALSEFGETLNPVTISNLRQPAWRKNNAKKWDVLIKEIERDFITQVKDRKFLFPIFRFFYYKEWGELCAVKDSFEPGKGYHTAAQGYFNLCEKAIEHIPGHKLLAEVCLSDSVRELKETGEQLETTETITFELVMKRVRQVRAQGMEAVKKLLPADGEKGKELGTVPNEENK